MGNHVGEAQIGVNFDFLAKALTAQGIKEGSITQNQYFIVTDAQLDEDNDFLVLECDVYEVSIN